MTLGDDYIRLDMENMPTLRIPNEVPFKRDDIIYSFDIWGIYLKSKVF